ncbi:hypothetical protein AB0H94_04890 [Streptomyces purpurascens]|uniref:hypothetical protein n=1 Tax=Streptomyces purpurascens TaxID=1924 RepID=UPI0033EF0C7A
MADREPIAHQFMDLTAPEYAYMFGFLQADGHLAKGTGQKGRLTVEINARDIGLLRQFQKLTPYYSSVRERTRSTNFAETHNSAIWSLCSLEARTKLNELGLPYGRKSAEITPPRVTGAERTLKRNTRDSIYNIVYMKEHAQDLAAHLYYPGCLSLERKQVTAASIRLWERPEAMGRRPPRIKWTAEMDRILLAAPTIAHAAAELGYSKSPCQNRRWKLLHGIAPRPE